MNIYDLLITFFAAILPILGIIAFLVTVITEITKNIGVLKRIPTDVQVVLTSAFLCLFAYFAYCSYFSIEIQWYYITGSIISSFIVSFWAMYGWEKLSLLYKRFKK